MAMTDMTRPDARAKMRRMRLLRGHPAMAGALADADISKSQALAIAEWTRKLPAELRAETIKILVQAAQAGASLDDLRMIAGVALEKWRASRPDADEDGFDDRYVQVATTFGGAGVIRGNLTPECAAAVQAVLEALGKKAGAGGYPHRGAAVPRRAAAGLRAADRREDGARTGPARTPMWRCTSRSRSCGSIPGAPAAEEVWLRGTAGEPGYLTGKDAEAAACDAVAGPGGHRARGHAGGGQDHRPGAGRGRHHPGRRGRRPGRRRGR